MENTKIKELDGLSKIISQAKTLRLRVIFANGCFDLLHVGHIRYLQAAKQIGDLLVVGINSDAAVRKLKGKNRPFMSQSERAQIISELGCVDYVTVFDELTADRTLSLLKPDVHTKGTDYTEDTVPERETVLKYGGRIAIAGDKKNHSTRHLVSEIREKLAKK